MALEFLEKRYVSGGQSPVLTAGQISKREDVKFCCRNGDRYTEYSKKEE